MSEVRKPEALRRRRQQAEESRDAKPSAQQRRKAARADRTRRANEAKDSDSDAAGGDDDDFSRRPGQGADPYADSDEEVEGMPSADMMAELMAQMASGAGAAGDDDQAFYETVTPEERERYRKARAQQWADELPPRMRKFIRQCVNDVALRIYCDIAIRLPMMNANPDEVLNMCEQFGDVEYVAKLENPNMKDGGTAIAADGGGCAHLVRFNDGMDAIRCYLSLNGAVVDPVKYNAAVEQLAMLATGNSTGDPEEEKDALTSPDVLSQDGGNGSRLFNPDEFVIASADKENRSALIFVTVDFFRMGLAAPTQNGGTAARCTLVSGRTDQASMKQVKRVPPTVWLAERLSGQAQELAELYPSINAYEHCPWERFCFAANLLGFLHSIPPAPAYRSLVQRFGRVSETTEWDPSSLSAAHEGLQRVSFDMEALIKLVDSSRAAEDIITGTKYKPTTKEKVLLKVRDALRNRVIAAATLSCVLFMLVLVTWLILAPAVLKPASSIDYQ